MKRRIVDDATKFVKQFDEVAKDEVLKASDTGGLPSDLDLIASDDFVEDLDGYDNANKLYAKFRHVSDVAALIAGLREESVKEFDVTTHIEKLLMAVKPGEEFWYDKSLAALLFALHEADVPWGKELIAEAAQLDVTELPHTIGVARKIVKIEASIWSRLDETLGEK